MARRFVDINFRANRFENARLASRGKQEGRTKRQSARHTDSSRRKERARVISSGGGEKEQVCQCCLHGEYSRNNYNAISGAENMSGWSVESVAAAAREGDGKHFRVRPLENAICIHKRISRRAYKACKNTLVHSRQI